MAKKTISSESLEDLLREAVDVHGLKAVNVFVTSEGYQCNVGGSDRYDYKIKKADDIVDAIKLALVRRKRDTDII